MTELFLFILSKNKNTSVTRGKSSTLRRVIRRKLHIQLGGRTCDRRWQGASTKSANQRCGGRVTIVHTYIVCRRLGGEKVEQKFNHCIRNLDSIGNPYYYCMSCFYELSKSYHLVCWRHAQEDQSRSLSPLLQELLKKGKKVIKSMCMDINS